MLVISVSTIPYRVKVFKCVCYKKHLMLSNNDTIFCDLWLSPADADGFELTVHADSCQYERADLKINK